MKIIKNTVVAAGLFALASCAGHQVRLSGGGALTELHGEASQTTTAVGPSGAVSQTQTIKETAGGGTTYRGRAELNQKVGSFENTTAGVYIDVGMSEGFDVLDDTSSKHLAGGVIFRHYLTEGDVRPFVEGRVGYRHTWLDVGSESGNGPGLDAGGGVGLEFGPAFILLEYSTGIYSIDNFDARTDEFGAMIGGKLDF